MSSTYTAKHVKQMIDMYSDNPCLEVVDKLSVLLNKPRKSIISKLSKEGVYQRKGYLTKTGKTPITKLQVCRSIEDALDSKLPGLDKAPKSTLISMEKTIVDLCALLEDTLEEIKGSVEVERVREDIFDILNSK